MSGNEDKLKIDSEGNFYKWKKVFEVEEKVVQHPSIPTHGYVPGADLPSLLGRHVAQTVKITIEIKNES